MTLAEDLSCYGEVAIFNHGDGWKCTCQMFVTGKGVKVEVASDWKLPSIEAAIGQCLERCQACIVEMEQKSTIKRLKQV